MRQLRMLLAIAVLVFAVNAAQAEDKPDATLKLTGGSVAAGIGYSWASGTLAYQGKEYPVSVKGLSVGDVGITNVEASGNVYHLKSIADFDGNYTAAGAGATLAGGASAVTMKNQNGVVVNVVSTTQGLKFALAVSGVDMRIKK